MGIILVPRVCLIFGGEEESNILRIIFIKALTGSVSTVQFSSPGAETLGREPS